MPRCALFTMSIFRQISTVTIWTGDMNIWFHPDVPGVVHLKNSLSTHIHFLYNYSCIAHIYVNI